MPDDVRAQFNALESTGFGAFMRVMVNAQLDDAALAHAYREAQIVWWYLVEAQPTLKKPQVIERLKKRIEMPNVVEAVCATAVSGVHVSARMVGLLALEKSPESLDALLGYFGHAETNRDERLNVFRALRLLPDVGVEVEAMLAKVEATFETRVEASPAHTFFSSLSIESKGVCRLRFVRQGKGVFTATLGLEVDTSVPKWFVMTVSLINASGMRHAEATPSGVNGDLGIGVLAPERLHEIYAALTAAHGIEWSPTVQSLTTTLRGKNRARAEAWALGSG